MSTFTLPCALLAGLACSRFGPLAAMAGALAGAAFGCWLDRRRRA